MPFSKLPNLKRFFSVVIFDIEADADLPTTQTHAMTLSEKDRLNLTSEIRSFLSQADFPLSEIGSESNRWFGSEKDAKEWLSSILNTLDQAGIAGETLKVLDSNGALLSEGDSVTVIKDLKVKGGSSDLKRGTLIKHIRLTQDLGLIECKVDGSVLVLKTEFLKKN